MDGNTAARSSRAREADSGSQSKLMSWATLRTEDAAVRTMRVEGLQGSLETKCSTIPSMSRGAILAQARKERPAK